MADLSREFALLERLERLDQGLIEPSLRTPTTTNVVAFPDLSRMDGVAERGTPAAPRPNRMEVWMGLSSGPVRIANASFALSTALSILAVACDGPQATPEGRRRTESHFAVLPVDSSTSILGALESTNGKPKVCVGLIGFGKNQTRAEART